MCDLRATTQELGRLGDRMDPGRAKGALERARDRLARPLFFPGARGKELARAIAILDQHVEGMIRRRREAMAANQRVPDDLLTRLLAAKDDASPRDPELIAARDAFRDFVDARVLSIFEGAEETLALKVIARGLLEDALATGPRDR